MSITHEKASSRSAKIMRFNRIWYGLAGLSLVVVAFVGLKGRYVHAQAPANFACNNTPNVCTSANCLFIIDENANNWYFCCTAALAGSMPASPSKVGIVPSRSAIGLPALLASPPQCAKLYHVRSGAQPVAPLLMGAEAAHTFRLPTPNTMLRTELMSWSAMRSMKDHRTRSSRAESH